MPTLSRMKNLFRNIFAKQRTDRDLDDEVSSYAELLAQEKIRAGVNPDEARRTARLELGGIEQVKEQVREARAGAWLDSLFQDLRYGARMLRKNPGFTAVAVLTLALGIGANSAIFSLVNAVLFQPLPVKAANELVDVYTTTVGELINYAPIAYPDYVDFRDKNTTLQGLAAFVPNFVAIEHPGGSEMVPIEAASGNYFDTLGVKPLLGRTFDASQDQAAAAYPVAVLSYSTWQRRFGADPQIIGKTIVANGNILTIIGIAPHGFNGLLRGLAPGLWVPLSMDSPLHLGDPIDDRGSQWLFATGRLKPRVSLRQAQAEFSTIADSLAREYPKTNKGRTVGILAASKVKFVPDVDGALYASAYVLLAFVGLVLLIACANISGMLLARAATRHREIALRLALGAGRFRLIRQLLTESLLLALLGGTLGLFLTALFNKMLTGLLQEIHLPVPFEFGLGLSIDVRVFAFTLAVVTAATLLFGLIPAFKASRVSLTSALKENSGALSGGRARHRMLGVLVVGQVAISLILLICAGLTLRTLLNSFRADPGFASSGVATASIYPSFAGYDKAKSDAVYRQLTDRIRAVPGVQSVGLVERLPLTLMINITHCAPQGKDSGPIEQWPQLDRGGVGPGYFSTMRIPIVAGREFTETDNAKSAPVVVVNQTLAKEFWPGKDPIGQRVKFEMEGEYFEVVGVARDGKYRLLGESPRPFIYQAVQQGGNPDLILLARVTGDPRSVYAAIREAVRRIDPKIPFMQFEPLEDRTSLSLLPSRVCAALFSLLGLVGLVLASAGLYGVISYTASQRTHEIGIRMALGAKSIEVLRLVLRQGLVLTLAGVAVGLAGALAGTRVLSVMLYGVTARDPLTFTAVIILLASVALAACWIPARRAMRVDPMVALRHE
jgi:macrolide transport system ATP-binding/permease protein